MLGNPLFENTQEKNIQKLSIFQIVMYMNVFENKINYALYFLSFRKNAIWNS